MGANNSKRKLNSVKQSRTRNIGKYFGRFIYDEVGDAVVEATILFPVMTMIFASLVLLSIYLPAQAALQRATQFAATALATEMSDTWLFYGDEDSVGYYRESDKDNLVNVYAKLFNRDNDIDNRGKKIVMHIESFSLSSKAGELNVTCSQRDYIIYKEITVEASREYTTPVDLTFIKLPRTITVAATSTAVVLDTDEFVRNVDIAVDFTKYVSEKFGLDDIGDTISSFGNRVKGILGW